MVLEAADFVPFFLAIHDHEPFPWQKALVAELDDTDEWPEVLDLPTGSGKTAALDAAVFHLALRHESPQKSALRIALVVDRRLIVDDALGRARRIADALARPERVPAPGRQVVAEVARRLQELAGEGEPPLVTQRLRGGVPLEHDWARTPRQPTILCSTVDQVGSRLLFRGYGVADRMKPVHAGLLGVNTLLLLDEAHLSEPFRQTLTDVREIGEAAIRTVWLSATPGESTARRHGLTKLDHLDPVLKARLNTRKPAKLSVVRSAPVQAFATAARAMADRLQSDGVSPPAVGVVVNRVDLARRIFNELHEDAGSTAVLLIGRSRGIGRDRIVETIEPFRTGATRTAVVPAASDQPVEEPPVDAVAEPLFVVATQCLEVGVDLDLDGLVTQAASLDALRQRFGRLNRGGRQVQAAGAVLALAAETAKKADDPVYGDRLAKTWEALHRMARNDEVDFGYVAFEARRQECSIDVGALAAPRAAAPVLMPAYLDLWSQTSPPPTADPDVGLFLHGVDHASAGVSIVWRSDITAADLAPNAAADLKMLLSVVPPRAEEMVEVPLWSARAWLRGHRDRADSVSDAPERDPTEESDSGSRAGGRWGFRWAGADDPRTGKVSPSRLQPGDVLVVPATYGGCDEFGWAPDSDTAVVDVADDAAWPFRRRKHAVRIARDVARDAGHWERLSEILADDGATGLPLVERLLEALPVDPAPTPDEDAGRLRAVREPLEALLSARRGRITKDSLYTGGVSEGGVVLVAVHGLRDDTASGHVERAAEGAPATEDDTLSRTAQHALSLDDHTRHVVDRVTHFVRRLALPDPIACDLKLAAFLHDAGKADRRFQILLSGADPWNRAHGPAMAKSERPSPKGAWARAGLPPGWRHEALSVRMAQTHPRFAEANDPMLVLWLIATHHGFGRPFFGFADPRDGRPEHDSPAACLGVEQWQLAPGPGLESLAFDVDGADWSTLYGQLRRRYGMWGLAHLEAILRLSDHRASEAESMLESTP